MIGLGTNRLSASRLAGLREASQFRNGQWIEGAGSWYDPSPYSEAATRALKAAFSAAQWAIIRDYGCTTPYLAAINAFAPEDPYIMYSLIPELGKKRRIHGDDTAYIVTSVVVPRDAVIAEAELIPVGGGQKMIIGWYAESTSWYELDIENGQYLLVVGNGQYWEGGSAIGVESVMRNETLPNETKKCYVNGVLKMSAAYGDFQTGALYIFARNWNGTPMSISSHKISYVKFMAADETPRFWFVPCKHKVNGVEQCGMLDIVNVVWYGNANSSGSFTISDSPS